MELYPHTHSGTEIGTQNPAMSVGVYFNDPRLEMTMVGRLLIRSFAFLSYASLAVVCLAGLSSGVARFQYFAALLTLFLLDRFVHFSRAKRLFSEMPGSGRVNIASCTAPAAIRALEKAYEESVFLRIGLSLAVLHQFMKDKNAEQILRRLDTPPDEFRQRIDEFVKKTPGMTSRDKAKALEEASSLMKQSYALARTAGHEAVEFSDLCVAAASSSDESVARVLEPFSLSATDFARGFLFISAKRNAASPRQGRIKLKHAIMNRAWTSRPTPILDRYGYDLTDLARQGLIGFMVGHRNDYERLVAALARPVNPNVLLVGGEGIGKETMVSRLAYDIVSDRVPEGLFDRRLVRLDIATVVADTRREEFSGLVKTLADEILTAGNIILYIPDIHLLTRSESGAYLTAADALLPIIKNNAFPVIGTTYPREFISDVEPRSDFTAIFEVIHVEEMTPEDTEELCIWEAATLEKGSRVVISFAAIRTAVALAKKYLRTKPLPSSAVELLKEAHAVAVKEKTRLVDARFIERLVEAKVHIPLHEVGVSESEGLLHMEEAIHKELIDQDEAVKAVAEAIREYRSGLSRGTGPIASFLFVGPTGVGKTELAKILARLQFGSDAAMIRFDMTEFQDKASYQRFIGSPDKAVSGMLTEAVFEKPYSLILLDEFEKAFPDILNLFLQVLDDGRLTDNLGRVVDFQNTIIIATSNAHSDILAESLRGGESMEQVAEYFKTKLTDVFRAELLNRFSKVVVFKNLSPEDVLAIARLNLAAFINQLAAQGIELSFDDEAVKMIAKMGFDPVFGARPLRQVIAERLRSPLSEMILKKELVRGSRAAVCIKSGALAIEHS